MSGGVDSAVALLRERAGGGDVVGLTLRLWIDDQAPDAERACCSPAAVAARARELPRARDPARDAGRPRSLPPRRSWSRSWRAMRAARRPNPCTTCNGSYRLAALVDAAERLGAPRVATGHYARLVRARRPHARGARRRRGQGSVVHARARALGRARAPAAAARRRHQGRRARRGRRGGHGGGHRAREPGRLLPRRRRARRLPRARGRAARRRAASATRPGTSSGATRARSPTRRASGAASGSRPAAPLYVLRADAARNELVVGPRSRLARSEVTLRDARVDAGCGRVHAKLRARSPTVAARVEHGARGRAAAARGARLRGRSGTDRSALRRRRMRGRLGRHRARLAGDHVT